VSQHHLVVVPHTHWDREWHRTQEEFRHRLVRLLDGVLDLLEGDPAFRHFMLDGQAIVADDYLEVRPEAAERLAKLVRDGRLLAGPWYVLPDEWLVSGEALLRNLRLGLRRCEVLGGAMRLGYVPDQFGHVGQLPQVLAGFGFEAAVLWRGVGAQVETTTFLWEAPDGTRLFTVYLPHGYGNAVHLPLAPEALAERLAETIRGLERFSRIPSLLLMNGTDHVAPQPGLPAALEAAVARLPGVTVEIGTLPGFVARARREAGADLPVHPGELRSGLRAPLLPGCASARMAQNRRDFANDVRLTRHLEPLAAWLAAVGGEADPGLLAHAWRVALESHPHDSICGCSTDRVHEHVEMRLARAEEISRAQLAEVTAGLAGRIAAPPATAGLGEALAVWNPGAGGPGTVDATLELELPERASGIGPLHLRDAAGRRLPAQAELLAASEDRFRLSLPRSLATRLLPALAETTGGVVRAVRWRREGARLDVDIRLADAGAAIDVRAVARALEAELGDPSIEGVDFQARSLPRVRLRFADDLPGWGLRVYRVAKGTFRGAPEELRVGREGALAVLENRFHRIEVQPDGRVDWLHRASGARVHDALRVVSEGDRGDEYNFDPVPGGERVERPERVRVSVERGTAAASIAIAASYRVPAGLTPERSARSRRRVRLPVRLRLRLAPGVDRVEVEAEIDNTARDHRLRLLVMAPFAARGFEVESAFEVAERPIDPPPHAHGSERPSELPTGATPQRSFATLRGDALSLTAANRGGGEVEALPGGPGEAALGLTLLRAVGWLSRDDLTTRPGPAGPRLPTPGAQVPGLHRLEFALRLHAPGDPRRSAEAHRFAFPALAFPVDGTAEAPLRDGDRLVAIDDPGVVVSAIEPRADGTTILRVYNGTALARQVEMGIAVAGAQSLEVVDLAERPTSPAPLARVQSRGAAGLSAVLALGPWQIVNLRIA
jgi:alpha-mannosidase